jgi:bifunctional polynucleotide phosphatase/kinase
VYHSTSQELIVFVGLPASGKSTFAKKHLIAHGYTWVNQDSLKSKEKCVKACAEALAAGQSVVVDNTNPSAELRALYINAARKHGCPVRCFHFIVAEDVAKHLNMFREVRCCNTHGGYNSTAVDVVAAFFHFFVSAAVSISPRRAHFAILLLLFVALCACSMMLLSSDQKLTNGAHKHVPRIAYNMFKSKYQEPALREGFREIKRIDFVPFFANTPAGAHAKQLFFQMS